MKLLDTKARDMRNNLLLHNIPESRDEDCETVLKSFLVDEMKMDEIIVKKLMIERAHRVGPLRTNKTSRPIVAKFLSFKEKEMVLQNWYSLSSTKGSWNDVRRRKRLTQQLPPEILQKRSQNHQLIENAKTKAPHNEVKHRFQGDNVIINNQVIKPLIKKLTVEDILNVDPGDLEEAQKLPNGVSKPLLDRGSSFVAHTFTTHNINEVRKAYKLVVANPAHASASHNILAFSINKEIGWEDDHEMGAGRFITTWLKNQHMDNMTIVITRQYGGTHLGTQRFENMLSVVKEAIKNTIPQ